MTHSLVIAALLLGGLISPSLATVDQRVVGLAQEFSRQCPNPPITDIASFALRTADSLIAQ
ncbi:unnamed protein product, partial [Prorocentrum cordatum]